MAFSIKILGSEQVAKKLQKTAITPDEARKVMTQGAFIVSAEVKESIAGRRTEPRSVDTGRFLNSVDQKVLNNYEVEVYSDVKYAKPLEHGTTRIKGRHHFRNSANRKRTEVINFIKTKLFG